MTPETLLAEVVDPALAFMRSTLKGGPSAGDDARVMLLAIAGQESGCAARRQNGGPARSYWQFEKGGGCAGVLNFATTGPWTRQVCAALDIPSDETTVFEAMAWNDILGPVMARMLLYTDPAALPKVGAQEPAYDMYLRIWRPGKPDHSRWAPAYDAAMKAVAGTAVG